MRLTTSVATELQRVFHWQPRFIPLRVMLSLQENLLTLLQIFLPNHDHQTRKWYQYRRAKISNTNLRLWSTAIILVSIYRLYFIFSKLAGSTAVSGDDGCAPVFISCSLFIRPFSKEDEELSRGWVKKIEKQSQPSLKKSEHQDKHVCNQGETKSAAAARSIKNKERVVN